MTQTTNVEVQLQNTTVTETDNVADGPKHYHISISEGLIIGDGSPADTNPPNEVNDELSTNIQISESVSFSDGIEKQSILPGIVEISESISLSDNVGKKIPLDLTVNLNEFVAINAANDGAFGIGTVKINESILSLIHI